MTRNDIIEAKQTSDYEQCSKLLNLDLITLLIDFHANWDYNDHI